MAVAGAALSWLRDNIQLFNNITQSQDMAEHVRSSRNSTGSQLAENKRSAFAVRLLVISRNNNRDLERGKEKRKKERKKNLYEENGNRGRSTQVETHEHYISRSSLLELFQSSFLLIILFPSRCYYTPRTAVSNREKGNERSSLSEERQREREREEWTG